METSKRRQIPTMMSTCPNFSFRGLRKKNSLRFFVTDFVTDFCHSYKLRISQQRQPSMHAHGRVYYGRAQNYFVIVAAQCHSLAEGLESCMSMTINSILQHVHPRTLPYVLTAYPLTAAMIGLVNVLTRVQCDKKLPI